MALVREHPYWRAANHLGLQFQGDTKSLASTGTATHKQCTPPHRTHN